jgi:hypothetical protein
MTKEERYAFERALCMLGIVGNIGFIVLYLCALLEILG